MRMTRTTTLAMTLALGLTLAACGGGNDAADTPTSDPSPAAVPAPAPDDDATTDDATTDVGSTDDGSTDSPTTDGESTSPATGDAGSFDPTASGLAAIEAAEAEAGGTAYEVDDEEGVGSWEVDVAVGDRSVEVTVGADGSVEETEDDQLESEDRAGLEAATVTITEAVEAAVAEVGGQLDDVELEDEDGTWVWEVSLDDIDAGGEVDVRISVTTGEVVSFDG